MMIFKVHRQVYDLAVDPYEAQESRDRNQFYYYGETFSPMQNTVGALLTKGTIAYVSATAAEAYKTTNPGGMPDPASIRDYFDWDLTNRNWISYSPSMLFVTIANPMTYAVAVRMEVYRWNKHFSPLIADSLVNFVKRAGQQYFVTSVDTDNTGSPADVRYPQNHAYPAAGAFAGQPSTGQWEGHTGISRDLNYAVKRMSTRKWRTIPPGGKLVYKVKRPGIGYPGFANYAGNFRRMDFLLRFVFKSDILYVGKTVNNAGQIVQNSPVLALKFNQNYTVKAIQLQTPGVVHVIQRDPVRTRDAFPQPTEGNVVGQPQTGGGTMIVEEKSAMNPT